MITALIKSMEDRVRTRFTFLDFGMLKAYGFIPGLLIGAFFPDIMKKYWPLLAVLFVVLLVRFIYVMWIKK